MEIKYPYIMIILIMILIFYLIVSKKNIKYTTGSKIANTFYHIFVIIPFLLLILNMVLNYIYRDNWDNMLLSYISWIVFWIMIVCGLIVKILTFQDDK